MEEEVTPMPPWLSGAMGVAIGITAATAAVMMLPEATGLPVWVGWLAAGLVTAAPAAVLIYTGEEPRAVAAYCIAAGATLMAPLLHGLIGWWGWATMAAVAAIGTLAWKGQWKVLLVTAKVTGVLAILGVILFGGFALVERFGWAAIGRFVLTLIAAALALTVVVLGFKNAPKATAVLLLVTVAVTTAVVRGGTGWQFTAILTCCTAATMFVTRLFPRQVRLLAVLAMGLLLSLCMGGWAAWRSIPAAPAPSETATEKSEPPARRLTATERAAARRAAARKAAEQKPVQAAEAAESDTESLTVALASAAAVVFGGDVVLFVFLLLSGGAELVKESARAKGARKVLKATVEVAAFVKGGALVQGAGAWKSLARSVLHVLEVAHLIDSAADAKAALEEDPPHPSPTQHETQAQATETAPSAYTPEGREALRRRTTVLYVDAGSDTGAHGAGGR